MWHFLSENPAEMRGKTHNHELRRHYSKQSTPSQMENKFLIVVMSYTNIVKIDKTS